MNTELPMLTPLTEIQNADPQVISNPISDNSHETNVTFDESFVSPEHLAQTYPQRSNKGISKKQYEPAPKANVKYPINNFASTHKLSKSYALTIN